MLKLLLLGIALCGLPAAAFGLELVANGDFEQDYTTGWAAEFVGSAATATRGTSFDGDPDYEVLVQKGTGNGSARLHQLIPVPSVDLAFSAALKCMTSATSGGPWAAGALLLQYEDEFANVLGTTAIGQRTALCPWTNSGTFHWIPAVDQNWHDYGFVVADELAFLSEVDPQDVRRIRIVAAGVVGGDC